MKKLILLVLVLASLTVSAQDTTTVEQYCRMIVTNRALSTKVNIDLDFGEERRLFTDNRLRDEISGKLKKFNSVVDALNYMGSQGWSLVNAFSTNEQYIYHYYFRKRFKISDIHD